MNGNGTTERCDWPNLKKRRLNSGVMVLPPANDSASPRATVLTPSVVTMLLMPSRVTSVPETSPKPAAASSTTVQSTTGLRLTMVLSQAEKTTAKPATPAMDKSTRPVRSGTIAAMARMPMTASLPRMVMTVTRVGKYCGLRALKMQISASSTHMPLKRRSRARWPRPTMKARAPAPSPWSTLTVARAARSLPVSASTPGTDGPLPGDGQGVDRVAPKLVAGQLGDDLAPAHDQHAVAHLDELLGIGRAQEEGR